jgi:single-stranded DNA-specific DHH superfamily exonuclease
MSATPEFTGPTPEAGQRFLLGAMRCTGDTEQVLVMTQEDRELYHVHLQTFRDEYQPQGATEDHLVQSMADVSWRLNRVVALETNLLTLNYSWRDLVKGLLDQAKALASLSLHTQRLSRQFERTVAQLRDLQKTRRSQEQQDLDRCLDLMELHEEKGQTYSPSEDGFVFSEAQIHRAIRARRRDRLLDETHRAAA